MVYWRPAFKSEAERIRNNIISNIMGIEGNVMGTVDYKILI